jgi:dCMP deaminase
MKRRVGCVLVRERRVISTGYNGTPRHLTNCNEGGCMKSPERLQLFFDLLVLYLRETHIDQVRDATVEKEEVLAYRHVFAFMLKRTLCWKQAESVYVKVQYSIAIRQIPQPLLVDFQMLMIRRCPCLTCTVKIAQVGISEVVYSQGYNMDQEVCLITTP